jgi:hypothetical protein
VIEVEAYRVMYETQSSEAVIVPDKIAEVMSATLSKVTGCEARVSEQSTQVKIRSRVSLINQMCRQPIAGFQKESAANNKTNYKVVLC